MKKLVCASLASIMCTSMLMTSLVSYADYSTAYTEYMNTVDGLNCVYSENIVGYAEVATEPVYNKDGRLIGYDFKENPERFEVIIDFKLWGKDYYSIAIKTPEDIRIPSSKVIISDDSKWTAMRIYGLDLYNIEESELQFGNKGYVTFNDSPCFSFTLRDCITLDMDFTEEKLKSDFVFTSGYTGNNDSNSKFSILEAGSLSPSKDTYKNYMLYSTGVDGDKKYIAFNKDKKTCKISDEPFYIESEGSSASISDDIPAIFDTTLKLTYEDGTVVNYPTYKMYTYDSDSNKVSVDYLYNKDWIPEIVYITKDSSYLNNFTSTFENYKSVFGSYMISDTVYNNRYKTRWFTFEDKNGINQTSFYWVKNSLNNPKIRIDNQFDMALINKSFDTLGNTDLPITKISPIVSATFGNVFDKYDYAINEHQSTVTLNNGTNVNVNSMHANTTISNHVQWYYPSMYSLSLDVANTITNNKDEDVTYFYDASSDIEVEIKTGIKMVNSVEEVILPEEVATEMSSTEVLTEDELPTDEFGCTVIGDANVDGVVDILDVITVNKTILGKNSMSKQGVTNSDINRNKVPDATDSLSIMKLIVKLLSKDDIIISWKS